jgi:alkanesulfonate monooxygenase SsuD/methylene tetrahydromethanopterin reductase-like flavin-dependent oxidoreductase (luciferase family)
MNQVVRAEEMGFTHFWTVEHHFQVGFAHSSAPEVLYGAISQRTSKIRIGHAVVLLPFPYNHPISYRRARGKARYSEQWTG